MPKGTLKNFEKSSKMVKSWHKMTKRRHLFQLAFIPFLIGTYISVSITQKPKIWVLRSDSLQQYTNMCTEYLQPARRKSEQNLNRRFRRQMATGHLEPRIAAAAATGASNPEPIFTFTCLGSFSTSEESVQSIE